jgi:PAS domain S-box-containing protein
MRAAGRWTARSGRCCSGVPPSETAASPASTGTAASGAADSLAALGAVFEHLPQGLIVLDPQLRGPFWNAAARRMHGFAPGEDANQRLADLADAYSLETPDGQGVSWADWPLNRLLRGERIEGTALRIRRTGTGWSRVYRYVGERVPHGPDRSVAFLQVEDVTERRTADSEDGAPRQPLRELERLTRLNAALTQINQAITHLPTRAELFRTVCEALVTNGGFAMAWIGWHAPETRRLMPVAAAGREAGYLRDVAIYTDDRPEGRGPSGTAFREARPRVCNDLYADASTLPWREGYARHGFRSAAALPVRFDGQVCAVLTVYSYEPNFFRDEERSLLVGAAADVSFALDNEAAESERRRAQAAVRSELAFSSTILESLPGVFYFYDDQGRFLRWNANFERVSGYRGDEIEAMHPLQFIAPADRERVGERIRAVIEHGEATIEAGMLAKSGRVTPYYFTGRRIVIDGRAHLIGMGIDIADRRRAEEQASMLYAQLEQRVLDRTRQLEAANQELEAFSYSVSHDLRAPLRAVNGFAEIVLAEYADRLPQDAAALLSRIRERAVHMGRLIDDLLAFSRLGRQPLALADVDMDALVRRSLEDIGPMCERRAVDFRIGRLPHSRCDRALVGQVWVNLLANAVKYTRGRAPAVVEIGASTEGPGTVYFVRDNGVGFDMRYADQLFGVFQRLHRADEFEGTGVGLAIVQNIVQRHGGRIWAQAEEGRGATFSFTLGWAPP